MKKAVTVPGLGSTDESDVVRIPIGIEIEGDEVTKSGAGAKSSRINSILKSMCPTTAR